MQKVPSFDLSDPAQVAKYQEMVNAETAPTAYETLDGLLGDNGLAHLRQTLGGLSLSSCCEQLAEEGRAGYMKSLKEKGVEKLGDRQKLASALAKAAKATAGGGDG